LYMATITRAREFTASGAESGSQMKSTSTHKTSQRKQSTL